MIIKHKNKIIAAVVITAALILAWTYGGSYNNPRSEAQTAAEVSQGSEPAAQTSEPAAHISEDGVQKSETGTQKLETGVSQQADGVSGTTRPASNNTGILNSGDTDASGADVHNGSQGDPGSGNTQPARMQSPESASNGSGVGTQDDAAGEASQSDGSKSVSPGEPSEGTSALPGRNEGSAEQSEQNSYMPEQVLDPNPASGNNSSQTAREAEARPLPADQQDAAASAAPGEADNGDGSFTVTLIIRCDTILDNMNLLNAEKHELVPADGVIFPLSAVTAYDGESIFNILQREMRRAGIHMTFRNTPIYNSAYIEAINNLYEFDAGELSGWMYCVTPRDTGSRWYPNYGCSRYLVKPGDAIEWNYTCDLGRDLGEYSLAAGWQS